MDSISIKTVRPATQVLPPSATEAPVIAGVESMDSTPIKNVRTATKLLSPPTTEGPVIAGVESMDSIPIKSEKKDMPKRKLGERWTGKPFQSISCLSVFVCSDGLVGSKQLYYSASTEP